MTGTGVVLVVVACVAAICPATSGAPSKLHKVAVDLYSRHGNRSVGSIKLFQPETKEAEGDVQIFGRMWGLPTGKHFAVLYDVPVHDVNKFCNSKGPVFQTWDDRLKIDRPLILFFDELERDSYRKLGNPVGKISLSPKDKNYMKDFFVLVYAVAWDQSGPLNWFFRFGSTEPVACGVSSYNA